MYRSSLGAGENKERLEHAKQTLQKHSDPASEIVNLYTGSINYVTLQMIKNLVADTASTFYLFGAPCNHTQRGFDVKRTFNLNYFNIKMRFCSLE